MGDDSGEQAVDGSPSTAVRGPWLSQFVSNLLLVFRVSGCRREAAMESGMLTAVQVPLCVAHG